MELAVGTLFAAKRDDTGSSEHEGKALKMKTPKQVYDSWETLFKMRRVFKLIDAEPITDPTICCQVHNYWQNKFIEEDLTLEVSGIVPLATP